MLNLMPIAQIEVIQLIEFLFMLVIDMMFGHEAKLHRLFQ